MGMPMTITHDKRKMTNMRIILASNSPRRRELLKGLDIEYEVEVMDGIDESYPDGMAVEEIPVYIAREKAAAYAVKQGEVLITADTVVTLDGEIMGKPSDADDARRMLHRLSGRTHHVITGVCITAGGCGERRGNECDEVHMPIEGSRQMAFAETTSVTFRNLSDSEIDYYVEHYCPFDKAGSYGVQEWIGYVGVARIDGSFYNVMGLPVDKVYEELKRLGAL